jgi:hypothetical protein
MGYGPWRMAGRWVKYALPWRDAGAESCLRTGFAWPRSHRIRA